MKQKFFTLLLGLAMVSVNAVADENITIKQNIGARTFVSSQNLDFSSLEADGTLRAYYISGYRQGVFTLSKLTYVPAYTGVILLGNTYTLNGNPIERDTTFTVPSYTANDDQLAEDRPVLKPNSKLIPVTDGYWNDAETGERVYAFDDRGSISDGKYIANQIKSVSTGSVQFQYYVEEYDQSGQGLATISNLTTMRTRLNTAYPNPELGTIIAVVDWDLWEEDTQCYPYIYNEFTNPRTGAVSNMWQKYSNTGWGFADPSVFDSEANGGLGAWYVMKNRNITTEYTQYILGVNGSTPVFKRCRTEGNGGTIVRVGSCFVRVKSSLLPAEARESISFVIEDEEDVLSNDENVTGIKNVNIDTQLQKGIYNMNGQKLDKMQKGLNIVNGKKFFVK